jgi:hypothetical protein
MEAGVRALVRGAPVAGCRADVATGRSRSVPTMQRAPALLVRGGRWSM